MNSVYHINKGINKSIEFKGLKAQYIWYLGGGVMVLLVLFGILYVVGVPMLACVAITLVLGAILIWKIFQMSNKYGEYGLLKAAARKGIPKVIRVYDRVAFIRLGPLADAKMVNNGNFKRP